MIKLCFDPGHGLPDPGAVAGELKEGVTMQEWLDKLPKWDKKLAEKLAPLTPYIQSILILSAVFLVYAALTWEPHYHVLLWAYLIAP